MSKFKTNLMSEPNAEDMTLKEAGDIIRLAMENRGLSQRQLAREVGLDFTLINSMLQGRRKAGLNSYDKVCRHLDIVISLRIPLVEGREENNSNR